MQFAPVSILHGPLTVRYFIKRGAVAGMEMRVLRALVIKSPAD